MLYCPITICPPSVPITVQSASRISHLSPNQAAAPKMTPNTTVRVVLNLLLNRLE